MVRHSKTKANVKPRVSLPQEGLQHHQYLDKCHWTNFDRYPAGSDSIIVVHDKKLTTAVLKI